MFRPNEYYQHCQVKIGYFANKQAITSFCGAGIRKNLREKPDFTFVLII